MQRVSLFIIFVLCLGLVSYIVNGRIKLVRSPSFSSKTSNSETFSSKTKPTHSILFIGNSLTFYNDLPGRVCKILNAEDDSANEQFECVSIAKGGKRLEDHLSAMKSDTSGSWGRDLKKAREQKWDYVVLQEQSMVPGLGPQNREYQGYRESTSELARIFGKAGATIGIYRTWGFKDGDKRVFKDWYPDFLTMNSRLNQGFSEIQSLLRSQSTRVIDLPVSRDFERIYREGPKERFLGLYSDDRHPSKAGTCVAAWRIAQSLRPSYSLSDARCSAGGEWRSNKNSSRGSSRPAKGSREGLVKF